MSDQNAEYAEEVFEDAQEDECPHDLRSSAQAANMAVKLFFNNNFEEGRQLMQRWAHKDMYHALGYGTFLFLQAILTFDAKDIEAAANALKSGVELCNTLKRKATMRESFGKMVKKTDYSTYTEVEMHAELCYAEVLLLRALLSFIEDETLMSLVKGGIKIRHCYQSYKECWYMLQSGQLDGTENKRDFESGVRFGVGTFNLMISQLPPKILKLLEFVGFSGNRIVGLNELDKGFELKNSVRRVLCGLSLLIGHLVFAPILGTGDADLDKSQAILDDQLALYPNGAITLFFQARYFFVVAKFDEAKEYYNKSRLSQMEWQQFHHVCYWELMWAHMMTMQWRQAAEYAGILLEESKWSKAAYAYFKSACLIMIYDEINADERNELSRLLQRIPGLKQKFAGKSFPIEKFAIKKAARFETQNKRLTLPAVELIFMWNYLVILGRDFDLINSVLDVVDNERKRLEMLPEEDRGEYYYDDLLLTYHLKGCCLSNMNSPLQAAECLTYVVNSEKLLKEDKYLVPCALTEIGMLHMQGENADHKQAKKILEYAKNNYKGHALEARLNFRIHAVLYKLKQGSSSQDTHSSGYKNGGDLSPSPLSSTDERANSPFETLSPEADINVAEICQMKIKS